MRLASRPAPPCCAPAPVPPSCIAITVHAGRSSLCDYAKNVYSLYSRRRAGRVYPHEIDIRETHPKHRKLDSQAASTRSGTPKWRPTGSRTFGGADLISGRLAHLISRLRVQQPCRKATVGSVTPSHLAPCLTRWRREGWHRLGHAVYHL